VNKLISELDQHWRVAEDYMDDWEIIIDASYSADTLAMLIRMDPRYAVLITKAAGIVLGQCTLNIQERAKANGSPPNGG
jgi:hypothetical protein